MGRKFYLYSIITHSTAIEGSTITEVENQLLFDQGITAAGKTLQEQMMNLDLKNAYEKSISLASLKSVLDLLQENGEVPHEYDPHMLKSNYKGFTAVSFFCFSKKIKYQ